MNIKKLGLLVGLCVTLSSYAHAKNNEEVIYSDPKLEIFNVQIIGPNGVVGESSKTHNFIPRKALFPNRKFLNPNDRAAKEQQTQLATDGGFFFNYEFPSEIDFSKEGEKKIVKSADKLWTIASTTKSPEVTIHQQLASIFRKNLRCFPKGKLQFLNGCLLTLPTPEQAKAEDPKIANQLNKQNGVTPAEYAYALNICPHGVCKQKIVKRDLPKVAKDDQIKEENKIELSVEPINTVEYYKPENINKNIDVDREELAPTATINLVDNTNLQQEEDNTKNTSIEIPQLQRANKQQLPQAIVSQPKPNLNDNVVAKGASLTFSSKDQTVKAKDKQGQVLGEVVQNYDDQIEKIKHQLNQASRSNASGNSEETTKEIQALRAELSELKQIMRENATRPIEIKQVEAESKLSFFEVFFIGLILVLGGVAGYLFYKTKILHKDLADFDDHDLETDLPKSPKKPQKATETPSATSTETNIQEKPEEQEDQDLLVVNKVKEDNTEALVAESKAKIDDQKRKQEDIVNKSENIVDAIIGDQNDHVEKVDLFDSDVVEQNFADDHKVEKIDLND